MHWNKKLVLTRRLSADHQRRLQDIFPDLLIVDCTGDRKDRIGAEIEDADYVFGRIKSEDFARARRLEFIQADTRGVDRYMYPELLESNVRVANAGDLYSPAMAEHTLALVLALYRNLPTYVRWQDRALWNPQPLTFHLLHGKTVGFLGTGSIARHTARLSAAFGCVCAGFNRSGKPQADLERVVGEHQLDALLGESDILVNTLPLTSHTRQMMNTDRFRAVKHGSLFINVGRGKTVDEAALIAALESGRLAGAGLDVFEEEPLPPDNPLWRMPNVIITSHRSGMGVDEEAGHFQTLVENLRRLHDGQEPIHLVDKSGGY